MTGRWLSPIFQVLRNAYIREEVFTSALTFATSLFSTFFYDVPLPITDLAYHFGLLALQAACL
jgi:hypothetical protein